jgi:HPt (histidine-containing phosphotransfer) domain-containing protein
MGSIRHQPRLARRRPPNDGFDALRLAFFGRLQSERVQLVNLSAALARNEDNPGSIFDDLVFVAHRLRGGAAIFDLPEIAAAGNALEQAAATASATHASHADAGVWAALVSLVDLLGTLSYSPEFFRDPSTAEIG